MKNLLVLAGSVALIFAFLSAIGCASVGVDVPATSGDRYVYAVTANAAIRQATADGVRAGKVSRPLGIDILAGTNIVRSVLDWSIGEIDSVKAKAMIDAEIERELPIGSEVRRYIMDTVDLATAKTTEQRLAVGLQLIGYLAAKLKLCGVVVPGV